MKFLVPAAVIVTSLAACSQAGSQAGFDEQAWQNADLITRTRVEMIPALIEEHELTGMTRTHVVQVLGEPTPTNKWREWDMVYVLGPTEYGVDHEWLVLRLDGDGRVTEYRQVAD